ncbi:hypothetical protein DFS34DRAFT_678778 [Phlyctochytrium arcticum]|nr:hypothetical protein DFS34DRAFT_678778 [Phlyctochytrium arcticum]
MVRFQQEYCEECDTWVITTGSLLKHRQTSPHPAHSEFRCRKCKRNYPNHHALEQHTGSAAHNPLTPQLRCPRCSKLLPSGPSALIMHLESGGKCASRWGVNRKTILAYVQQLDKEGTISNLTPAAVSHNVKKNKEMAPSSSAETPNDVIELPRHVCPDCPAKKGQFSSARALEQHLESAAHDVPEYHCPILAANGRALEIFGAAQFKYFRTLSGLSQHVERGLCKGGMGTYEEIMRLVTEKLFASGMKGVKGLKL